MKCVALKKVREKQKRGDNRITLLILFYDKFTLIKITEKDNLIVKYTYFKIKKIKIKTKKTKNNEFPLFILQNHPKKKKRKTMEQTKEELEDKKEGFRERKKSDEFHRLYL